jgi:hypothetical protein
MPMDPNFFGSFFTVEPYKTAQHFRTEMGDDFYRGQLL